MSTLSQLYVTVITGVVITSASFFAFGSAVRLQKNSNLVPRAWSRPVQVVKNNLGQPFCLSWLAWAIRQKYIDLLAGIPGTGTRMQGWSGPTLKTNLDGVIMLRYHVMLLKVSIVASVLCMLWLMPLFYTVACDPVNLGLMSCINQTNLTDFEVLTIANVPDRSINPVLNQTTAIVINETFTIVLQPRDTDTTQWSWIPGLSGRYMSFVLFVGILTWYTCYLLWYEWIECLALRRVYYLEADYHPERLEELDLLQSNHDPEDPFQRVRPPYLPHPEMRETIPNVSLNSVLYQLPDNLQYALNDPDDDNMDPNQQSPKSTFNSSLIERQLAATVDFFDQCVPNQPGFTSSVVAVSIVPDATAVSTAWVQWYKCGKRLRRLRYIKKLLEERKQMQRDGVKALYDYVDSAAKATAQVVQQVADRSKEEMENLFCPDRQGPRPSIDEAGVPMPSDGDGNIPLVALSTNHSDEQQVDVEQLEDSDPTTHSKALDAPDNTSVASPGGDEPDPIPNEFEGISTTVNPGNDNVGKKTDESNGLSGLGSLFATLLGKKPTKKDDDDEDVRNDPQRNDQSESNVHNPEAESSKLFSGDATDEEEGGTVYFDTKPRASVKTSGRLSGVPEDTFGINDDDGKNPKDEHFDYKDFDPQEFAKWIGFTEDTELDQLVDTLGVEQLSVYSREMSQSASNLCVYGCGLKSLRLSSIEQLENMLEDAWAAVREANADLLEARARIFRGEARKEEPTPHRETSQKPDRHIQHVDSRDDSKQSSPSHDDDDLEGAQLDRLSEHAVESDSEELRPLRSLPSITQPNLRKRVKSIRAKYAAAQDLVKEMEDEDSSSIADDLKETEQEGCSCRPRFGHRFKKGTNKAGKALTSILDHPSYAIVTFSSRQAAIAARQCLADGRGVHRWHQVDDIPTAPLADAPPCKPFFCRGCCRPVTLTLNYQSKKFRRLATWTCYVFFCCLYTVPLALTSAVLNPQYLSQAFPNSKVFQNPDSVFYRLFAGLSSGMLYSLFFSVLPQIFKVFANFEGSSSSMPRAENNALRFYWYFMLLTAFTGSTLAQMLFDGFSKGNFEGELKEGLQTVARTIPTQQAPVWLNWILVKTGNTLPLMYLFQFNTWLYGCLRMKCLNRAMRGGGPGGPPPYRIYIDSGTVFMCITSLAPCCPIIAPAATMYYMMIIPILRWLLIFVYRPKYDAGGNKLPYLHEIIISSLILGQILSAVVILLKQAVVGGGVVIFLTIPTFLFSQWTKEKFEKSYNDAGLLQTSMLDGWDDKSTQTLASREKYRAWLVDAHKASYVPICLSGGEDFLTSQPAVTVPTPKDLDYESIVHTDRISPRPQLERQDAWRERSSRYIEKAAAQKGAVFRRYLQG